MTKTKRDDIAIDINNGMRMKHIRSKHHVSPLTIEKAQKCGLLPVKVLAKHKHSEETKNKLSEIRKNWLKNNPEKHPWRKHQSFVSQPCEFVKKQLKERGYLFLEEYMPISGRYYSIDIAFPDKKIGIEINGNQHYERNGNLKPYYLHRHNLIEETGWLLLEIEATRVSDKNIIDLIEEAIIKRESSPIDIEKEKERCIKRDKSKNKCIDCGKEISFNSKRCGHCAQIQNGIKKNERLGIIIPSKEDLENLVSSMSLEAIGRKYNVSSNTIRLWAKKRQVILKKSNKAKGPFFCSSCGAKVRDRKTITCKKCYFEKLKETMPSKEELEDQIGKLSLRKIAKKYNVFHTTIKRWAKEYELL